MLFVLKWWWSLGKLYGYRFFPIHMPENRFLIQNTDVIVSWWHNMEESVALQFVKYSTHHQHHLKLSICVTDLRPHTRWAGRVCRGLCHRMEGDPPSSHTDTPHTPTSPHHAHSHSPQEPEKQSLIRWSREGRILSYYYIYLFFAHTTIMSSEAL